MNELLVTENPEVEGLGPALGINKKRSEEIIDKLTKVTIKSFQENKSAANTLQEISRIAENANELAFMCFSIGAYFESQRNPIGQLFNLLKSK